MFSKKGFPEVDELVLCTVKRIESHSAFVILDEFSDVEGMLHISEVALRGVKNIKDYLSVGKKIVCKVLRSGKGVVDVSLKRVNSGARKEKLNEARINNRLFRIIEHACVQAGSEGSINGIIEALINKHGSLVNAYEFLRNEGLRVLEGISIPAKVASLLNENFDALIKQLKVTIKRVINVSSLESDGALRIKKLLSVDNPDVIISYVGSGKFSVSFQASNYKRAEEGFAVLFKDLVSKGSSIGVKVSGKFE